MKIAVSMPFPDDGEERHADQGQRRPGDERVGDVSLEVALELPGMAPHPHDHVGHAGDGDQRQDALHDLPLLEGEVLADRC